MLLKQATNSLKTVHAAEVPQLVWSTGPVSYEYQFGNRALFDAAVLGSWELDGSLFASDATTLAIEGDALLGLEIGMRGSEFRTRQQALAPLWREVIDSGRVNQKDFAGLLDRAGHASWLNPVIDEDTYYIHAIAVKPEYRGRGVGLALIKAAVQRAREQGYAKFQLDVLSDNPAVSFYRSIGLEVLAETRAPKPTEFGVPPEYRMGMLLT